jgi:hypothetical protein
MAKYEFKVLVSDVELSDEHQEKIGRAVAQAGAAAVAEQIGGEAQSIPVGLRHWWCGIWPEKMRDELKQFAREQVERG